MSKKRPISHITGDKAIDIVKAFIPEEWVTRTLTPDYGIDLLIELFDFIDDDKKICETLGEFIYVQVKGTTNLEKKKIKIHPVYNVAKSAWQENKDEFMEIEVVTFPVETSLLDTVRRIGVSVCVLLFIVDKTSKGVYFICLNDMLGKYIQPQNPDYMQQETVTIPIPVNNKIDGTFASLVPLRLYGKRSKLYSAFTTIRYQLKELRHELSNPDISFMGNRNPDENVTEFVTRQHKDFILFFANQLLELDIWSIGNHMFALGMCKDSLDKLVLQIKEGKWTEKKQVAMSLMNEEFMHYPKDMNENQVLIHSTLDVWEQLDNMSSIYEEICREWFLPKFIGQLSSYPDNPEIKKRNHDCDK